MTRRIWVTHRFDGFHAWHDAPQVRSYLASPHRHLFHVKLTMDVHHDDREVEFHDLRDEVVGICGTLGVDGPGKSRALHGMSCEQIALFIAEAIRQRHDGRSLECEVSEDGELGAIVALA